MGTRNLTLVKDRTGATKIAQYGQWDGYPEGQGSTILNFIREKDNRDKLEDKLKELAFITEESPKPVKDFVEEYNKRCPTWSNEPDKRTDSDRYWYDNLVHRDIGGKILEAVTLADVNKLPDVFDKVIYLEDSSSFANDSLFCEWAYCVNYQTEKLEVFTGGTKKITEFSFDELPSKEEFCEKIISLVGDEEE